jgi:hypothetical protein
MMVVASGHSMDRIVGWFPQVPWERLEGLAGCPASGQGHRPPEHVEGQINEFTYT